MRNNQDLPPNADREGYLTRRTVLASAAFIPLAAIATAPQARAQAACEIQVCLRGLDLSAGMVVRQDHIVGIDLQRNFGNFAWINHRLIERAAKHFLECDQVVLVVEKDDGKHLVG